MTSQFTPGSALAGGALIGLAAVMLMAFNGRIAGISGIVNGALGGEDARWRRLFVLGLVVGGGAWLILGGGPVFALREGFSLPLLAGAGFLVGFGTRLGSGCTSGHGVCGIARLSPRSIVATLTFMAFGMLTVFVLRTLGLF